jgi:tRNA-dihydrouridine synthase
LEFSSQPRRVFGNGDIDTPEKAVEYQNRFGVDGIMVGRASIGYPWVFREIKHFIETGEHLAPPTLEERVAVCREHLRRSLEWKGLPLGIVEMRRHYGNYFKGFPGIKPFRMKLVTSDDPSELYDTLDAIYTHFSREGVFVA